MIDLNQIILRIAEKTDLPDLEWDGEFQHYRRLYADIYQNTVQGRAKMWVAELNHVGIIGQLFIQLESIRLELADGLERAYIYGFRIKPAYRGQGLGTFMMHMVEDDLAQRGFSCVNLNVAQDNARALSLYKNLGYKIIGSDPGIWSYIDHLGIRRQVTEPAWRMQKRIRSMVWCVNN